MEKKSIQLLSELTCADFVAFCKTNIIPHLVTLENERVQKLNKVHNFNKICTFLMLFIVTGFCIAFICVFLSGNDSSKPMGKISIALSGMVMIAVILAIFAESARKNLISPMFQEFKSSVYTLLFSYFGQFKYYPKEQPSSYPVYDSALAMVKGLKLFDNFNIYSIDDCITGVYNGLNLRILDLDLQKGEGRQKETIFDGVLLECDCNKKFHSTTIVRLNKDVVHLPWRLGTMNRVALEDPVFEKEFNVYSTDQTESRYILTAAFMNRLLKAQKKLGIPLTCSFENGKMYVAIHNNKDWFDIDFVNDSFTDIRTFQKILIDLVEVLSIIDTLNADSNIGM